MEQTSREANQRVLDEYLALSHPVSVTKYEDGKNSLLLASDVVHYLICRLVMSNVGSIVKRGVDECKAHRRQRQLSPSELGVGGVGGMGDQNNRGHVTAVLGLFELQRPTYPDVHVAP